jgi:hypothetical protein
MAIMTLPYSPEAIPFLIPKNISNWFTRLPDSGQLLWIVIFLDNIK